MNQLHNLGPGVRKFLCGAGIHEFQIIGFLDLDTFNLASENHQHITLAKCQHCPEFRIDPFDQGIIGDDESYIGLIRNPPPVRQERRKRPSAVNYERRTKKWDYSNSKVA
jgi:hypothetical protein